jgi:hypothetical protein
MNDNSESSSLVLKQVKAREAYKGGDLEASRVVHDTMRGASAAEHHLTYV